MVYTTQKPIDQLTQIEALVLINRWLKLPNYFWYDDKDELYSIKEKKLINWCRTEEIIVTRIVMRDAPVFKLMREQVAMHGQDLCWLDYFGYDWHDWLSENDNYVHFSALRQLVNEDYQRLRNEEQYHSELAEYEIKNHNYLQEYQQYQHIMSERQQQLHEYNKLLKQYEDELYSNFWQHLKTLPHIINEEKNILQWHYKNLSSKQKKRVDQRIGARKFFIQPKPQKPQFEKMRAPKKPQKPDQYENINPENYQIGELPEIEAAIEWVKTFNPDFNIHDLDEDYIYSTLEDIIASEAFEEYREKALQLFEKILNDEIKDAESIYEALTELPIDYSCIGIDNKYERYSHNTVHKDFSKWHEINLSPTGLWLIEFKCVEQPEITFHLPYNDNKQKFAIARVPHEFSSVENFGRAITTEEQELYPIKELVKILGYEDSDFPYELKEYQQPIRYYRNWHHWEDENENEDWEEDEDWKNY
jgi:hypothetical protein